MSIRTGRIKRVIADRGFGFIRDNESHEDLFFHATELLDDVKLEDLRMGTKVTFFPGDHKGRICCLDIAIQNVPDQASE